MVGFGMKSGGVPGKLLYQEDLVSNNSGIGRWRDPRRGPDLQHLRYGNWIIECVQITECLEYSLEHAVATSQYYMLKFLFSYYSLRCFSITHHSLKQIYKQNHSF